MGSFEMDVECWSCDFREMNDLSALDCCYPSCGPDGLLCTVAELPDGKVLDVSLEWNTPSK